MKLVSEHSENPSVLDRFGFDDFEIGLLCVARHFLNSFADPESQSWQQAYSTAIERWGELKGLTAAHYLHKVLKATLRCRSEGLAFNDPLCLEQRAHITVDELNLLQMLQHMRRDNTPAARDAVDRLTDGSRDAHVIQAGLSLASRFPNGLDSQDQVRKRPPLTVVK